MLHDQDTKMILMNPGERHALYELDIETGKIVEEWKVHEDVPVNHIAPDRCTDREERTLMTGRAPCNEASR